MFFFPVVLSLPVATACHCRGRCWPLLALLHLLLPFSLTLASVFVRSAFCFASSLKHSLLYRRPSIMGKVAAVQCINTTLSRNVVIICILILYTNGHDTSVCGTPRSRRSMIFSPLFLVYVCTTSMSLVLSRCKRYGMVYQSVL